MENLNLRLKRVGNSLGIIVPSEIVSKRNLKEGEELVISIESKNKTTIEDMLREAEKQKLKFKRSTKEILDEIDGDSD